MDILMKSLLAAGATAIILLVAKHSGPKLAGAIGGIPIVFAISYILVTMSDRAGAKDFLVGGIYGSLAALFFSGILIFFNNQFPKAHWLSFSVAYALCFFLAFGLVQFVPSSK